MSEAQSPTGAVLRDLGIDGALDMLGDFIVKQRWSGASDRKPQQVGIDEVAVLRNEDPLLAFCAVHVLYDDGSTMRYALPLGVRQPEDALAERAPEYMIGRIGAGDAARLLYDALADPMYVQACLRVIREDASVSGSAGGGLVGERYDDAALSPPGEPSVRLLSVQQSNTSLVLEEELFFKHLRRVEEGVSQELEMATALRAANFDNAVPVLGTLRYDRDTFSSPIVLLQPYLHNGTEGWNLALTSLRDLYADAEDEEARSTQEVHTTVDEQGGAFVAEAGRLGVVTANLHLALATPGLGPDFDPQPVDRKALAGWAEAMTQDLDALLRHPSTLLDPVRDVREAIVARFDALRTLKPEGERIRIHGDLHLGQVLRVSAGWVILDFEGEPDRTPDQRRQRSTPLRDVAGMLRSFDYAAAVALTERAKPDSDEWERMMSYGDAWAQANRDAFWSAYLETIGDHPMLPSPGEAMVLRRAFEVHKAVYEAGYELGHRPSWARIPVRFLLRGIT